MLEGTKVIWYMIINDCLNCIYLELPQLLKPTETEISLPGVGRGGWELKFSGCRASVLQGLEVDAGEAQQCECT